MWNVKSQTVNRFGLHTQSVCYVLRTWKMPRGGRTGIRKAFFSRLFVVPKLLETWSITNYRQMLESFSVKVLSPLLNYSHFSCVNLLLSVWFAGGNPFSEMPNWRWVGKDPLWACVLVKGRRTEVCPGGIRSVRCMLLSCATVTFKSFNGSKLYHTIHTTLTASLGEGFWALSWTSM